MAISVDTVYQKVLAFANKEQRGYITPQEFNLFADQAQKEIFEQYFYDINQWNRQHGNSTGHSDMLDNLEAKISAFELWAVEDNSILLNEFGDLDLAQFPNFYKLVEVRVDYGNAGGYRVVEETTAKEFRKYDISPLTQISEQYPYYLHFHDGYDRIKIFPHPPVVGNITNSSVTNGDKVKISYIKKPLSPNWGYVVVNDKALYNDNISVDFELHGSEESELVYRILAFAGIAIKQPDLLSSAVSLESAKVQQEKL
tara:strand:- start:25 stop:792 length:768 start_codon:yes stop_codon:yes gene_type:complete